MEDGATGLLVEPNNVKAITDALTRLIENPTLRREMGERGRARALAAFRWEDRWRMLEERLARV